MSRYFIVNQESGEILEFAITSTIRKRASSTVTKKPVERGSDVVDHIRNMPISISFTGVLVKQDDINDDTIGYTQYLKTLGQWREDKVLLSVHYDDDLERDKNCVVTEFEMDRDSKISDGWRVSMRLDQIEIGTAVTFTEEKIPDPELAPKIAVEKAATVSSKEAKLSREEVLAITERFKLHKVGG